MPKGANNTWKGPNMEAKIRPKVPNGGKGSHRDAKMAMRSEGDATEEAWRRRGKPGPALAGGVTTPDLN